MKKFSGWGNGKTVECIMYNGEQDFAPKVFKKPSRIGFLMSLDGEL